mmetsp:Transcript_26529/g.4643  ORF Transcript_26529/g.4643 Transcript_26529/m.4643 type:complete len:135 (+) Transcript_26529:4040-4444(+)
MIKVRLNDDWAANDVLSFWAGMFKNPANPTVVGASNRIDIKITVKLILITGEEVVTLEEMEYDHIETTYAGTVNNLTENSATNVYQKSGSPAVVGGTGFEVVLNMNTTGTALVVGDWIVVKLYERVSFGGNPTC